MSGYTICQDQVSDFSNEPSHAQRGFWGFEEAVEVESDISDPVSRQNGLSDFWIGDEALIRAVERFVFTRPYELEIETIGGYRNFFDLAMGSQKGRIFTAAGSATLGSAAQLLPTRMQLRAFRRIFAYFRKRKQSFFVSYICILHRIFSECSEASHGRIDHSVRAASSI